MVCEWWALREIRRNARRKLEKPEPEPAQEPGYEYEDDRWNVRSYQDDLGNWHCY